MLDCEFWLPLLSLNDGTRLNAEQARRILEIVVARSAGKNLQLVGADEHEAWMENVPGWNAVDDASTILHDVSGQPDGPCTVACLRTQRIIRLGRWLPVKTGDLHTCEFSQAELFDDQGKILSPAAVRRVIEVFLAQSDTGYVRLVTEENFRVLFETYASWRVITLASQVLNIVASPPLAKFF